MTAAKPDWVTRKAAWSSKARALRSKFEAQIVAQLEAAGVEFEYEQRPLEFTPPAKARRKTFDFWITTRTDKLIVVEAKGWWVPEDRIAELECIKQHPEIDIRYVFQRSKTPIRKGSKTTYANVCEKVGVLFADGVIPREWLDE